MTPEGDVRVVADLDIGPVPYDEDGADGPCSVDGCQNRAAYATLCDRHLELSQEEAMEANDNGPN